MIKMGQIASERVKTQTWELVNESIRIEKFLNGSEHTGHLQNAPLRVEIRQCDFHQMGRSSEV
jgi:hypothetical protein